MHDLINFLSQPLAMNLTAAEAFVGSLRTVAEQKVLCEKPQPYVISGSERIDVMALDTVGNGSNLIAVVPLSGALSMHGSWFTASTKAFASTLNRLDESSAVSTIVIPNNTPGGTVTGTMEAADVLRGIRERGRTHTVSVVEPMMASAGTWISTAAAEVVSSPSGESGSIGVISMYQDWSAALEKMGVKIDVERSPDQKARFSGVEPMDDAMREEMKDRNSAAFVQFTDAMAQNRGVSAAAVSKFGNGSMMGAEEALSSGLVDRIDTLEGVIAGIADKAAAGRSARRRASATARLKMLEVS